MAADDLRHDVPPEILSATTLTIPGIAEARELPHPARRAQHPGRPAGQPRRSCAASSPSPCRRTSTPPCRHMHTRRVQKWIIGSLRSTPRTQFSAVPEKFVKLPNRFPKASKLYDIYSTGSDEAEVVYEYNHKLYYQALFSVSRVFYDFLGQLPETGKFWSAGVPTTSCLEAAVAWAIATDIAIAPHILQEVGKYLPWLIPATPTGLTVRADPNDGTVLHLTWQDNANDETWFEVNNAAGSRKAPAHSGTGPSPTPGPG